MVVGSTPVFSTSTIYRCIFVKIKSGIPFKNFNVFSRFILLHLARYLFWMPVEIKIVSDKNDLKEFIFLPAMVHALNSNWVPPIYADEWKFYNPRYNHQLLQSDTVLLLANKNGKIAGRIMGIIHRGYNLIIQEKTARFFNLECTDDIEVSASLLNAVEKWAKEKGMNKLIGPFGFSDKDPQGLQIEGFQYLPVIATATNMNYLPKLVEQNGFEKEIDCVVYKIKVPSEIPPLYQSIYERVIKNPKIKVIEFRRRSELKKFIIPVMRLMNETYKSLYGFIEMSEDEMFDLAKKYLPMLDPEFSKVVIDEYNNPIAFIVSSPDISEGIKKARGKLFPFGFIDILSSGKKSKQLDLFLGAVKDPWKGCGLTAILAITLLNSARKRNLSFIDSHLILETNKPMRSVAEKFGGNIYKRYRIYRKNI